MFAVALTFRSTNIIYHTSFKGKPSRRWEKEIAWPDLANVFSLKSSDDGDAAKEVTLPADDCLT